MQEFFTPGYREGGIHEPSLYGVALTHTQGIELFCCLYPFGSHVQPETAGPADKSKDDGDTLDIPVHGVPVQVTNEIAVDLIGQGRISSAKALDGLVQAQRQMTGPWTTSREE